MTWAALRAAAVLGVDVEDERRNQVEAEAGAYRAQEGAHGAGVIEMRRVGE